jgi:hypothetical protein
MTHHFFNWRQSKLLIFKIGTGTSKDLVPPNTGTEKNKETKDIWGFSWTFYKSTVQLFQHEKKFFFPSI